MGGAYRERADVAMLEVVVGLRCSTSEIRLRHHKQPDTLSSIAI